MRRLHRYVHAHLHRRLFVWFGASIFMTIAAVFGVSVVTSRFVESPWQAEMNKASRFVSSRLEAVWDAPGERRALTEAAAKELELNLHLFDAGGRALETFGDPCERHPYSVIVRRGDLVLGRLEACAPKHRAWGGGLWRIAVVLLCAALVLWAASGKLARRLTRPLSDLARVARDIGNGKLQSRARLRGKEPGEVGMLAESINDMAAKIERQMAEQRELLAGVSHELRTPLTRMRVLIELAKDRPAALEELDREIDEIDALVGELLASARLDFSALRLRSLEAHAVATRAIERAGEAADRLFDEAAGAVFQGDASLIARALANLLDNAKKHGGGVRALRVKTRAGRVAFEVEDGGPGFSDEAARRLFQPFSAGGSETSSLGLGLALVRRIAEAHGGTAYAENIGGGGARVGFEVKG